MGNYNVNDLVFRTWATKNGWLLVAESKIIEDWISPRGKSVRVIKNKEQQIARVISL